MARSTSNSIEQTASHIDQKPQQGFTIVELLIVVVVIGILAAIALVSYNGVTQQAAAAKLKSDLKNASTQLDIARVQDGFYPQNDGSSLSRSEGTTLEYSSDGTTYCVSASSTAAGVISFHLDSTTGVIEEDVCIGHTAPTGGGQAQGNQGVVTTLAGSDIAGFADGTGAAAQFSDPNNVAVDASGNVYVADTGNHRIRKITPSGEVTTLAGSTEGFANGPGAAAQFNLPADVAVDSTGTVYIADTWNNRIRKVTPSGVVTTLAGSTRGYFDSTGTAAQFDNPYGIAVDASGNVYVADTRNHRIRKITPSGEVTTLAGSTQGYADGNGATAQFNYPNDVAVDASGTVYVADADNHRIRKITPSGEVTTLAGSGYTDEDGHGGFADGTGTTAQFDWPYGVAVDSSGNVYVADAANNRIRKITAGGVVTTLAGAADQFYMPGGVAVDSSGTVYIADTWNNRIRKID